MVVVLGKWSLFGQIGVYRESSSLSQIYVVNHIFERYNKYEAEGSPYQTCFKLVLLNVIEFEKFIELVCKTGERSDDASR